MDVLKEANLVAGEEVAVEELALIHQFSRKELTAEEVYTFAVRLCDNEIDRDGERFSVTALQELAEKFVGKSGMFDHQWSAKGQAARIYRTEVVEEPGTVTKAGDGYCYLKAWAYMLRTSGNADLIAEIEGGIKKEVSVGCAVSRATCSICGKDMNDREACHHVKGRTYNGKACYAELDGVMDAYEWSFVAVPAQPRAGVMKGFAELDTPEMRALKAEAEMGRRYLTGLRREVARLGGLCGKGLDAGMLGGIVDKLDEAELLAMKGAYERQVEERYPVGVQLSYGGEKGECLLNGAFLV